MSNMLQMNRIVVPVERKVKVDNLLFQKKSNRLLLNYLVRLNEYALWYHDTDLLCGFKINKGFES